MGMSMLNRVGGAALSLGLLFACSTAGCSVSDTPSLACVLDESASDPQTTMDARNAYVGCLEYQIADIQPERVDGLGSSSESGHADVYRLNSIPVKVTGSFFGRAGRAHVSVYLWQGQAVVLEHQDEWYEPTESLADAKVDRKEIVKYFIFDDAIARRQEDGIPFEVDAAESERLQRLLKELLRPEEADSEQ